LLGVFFVIFPNSNNYIISSCFVFGRITKKQTRNQMIIYILTPTEIRILSFTKNQRLINSASVDFISDHFSRIDPNQLPYLIDWRVNRSLINSLL
jgi:hypothetical protein